MAGSGLLALLDDITSILDDVAAMTKVAAQKTAGIVGDDLAVNAQGLVGLQPDRELPIVGKVALGPALNKVVLVPLALALPRSVITPLLMLGGAFLCYEGVHKIAHKHTEEDDKHEDALLNALQTGPEALAAFESQKVKQAIFTDVILSAEIVAVALGSVADEPLQIKAMVLSLVSLGMTVGVYGLVAFIVKLDDIGLHLQKKGGSSATLGSALVNYTPVFMRGLSVVGTIAMFMVGGGIILHGLHSVEEAVHHGLEAALHAPALVSVASLAVTVLVGMAVGALCVGIIEGGKRVLGRGGH